MDFSVEDLNAFLREKAAERWAAEQQPYLLSSVAPDLKARGQDYRSALGEERLKAFVKRMGETGEFRVVEHPRQKAKVGIVPVGEDFEFSEEGDRLPNGPGVAARAFPSSRERTVLDFLRILGHLPDPLLEEVSIPTKVLARLLVRR